MTYVGKRVAAGWFCFRILECWWFGVLGLGTVVSWVVWKMGGLVQDDGKGADERYCLSFVDAAFRPPRRRFSRTWVRVAVRLEPSWYPHPLRLNGMSVDIFGM